MSMIDYGAVVIKNGKIINENQFFQNMLNAVGWEDYPGKRYDFCDFTNEYGHSYCGECPKALSQTVTFDDGFSYENKYADCQGEHFQTFPHTIRGNHFAYIGDRDLTLCFYKNTVKVIVNQLEAQEIWCGIASHKVSHRLNINGAQIHIRPVYKTDNRVYHCSMSYKGDHYNVVFGYGIDPNMRVWNDIKLRYLGKRTSKAVDRLYEILIL